MAGPLGFEPTPDSRVGLISFLPAFSPLPPAGASLAMSVRALPFVRVESALTEFFESLTSDESSTYGGFDGQNGLFFPLMTNNGPFLV